jgi:hypothetical protein
MIEELETIWLPDDKLKPYVDEAMAAGRIELANVGGFNRWVVTAENGVQYMVRPESAKNEHKNTTEMP